MTAPVTIEQTPVTVSSAYRTSKRWRAVAGELAWHLLLSVFGLALLAPLIWLVSTSLKEPSAIFVMPPVWIPNPVRWENYPEALTAQPFGRFLWNTLTITFFATLGTLLTASLAAFSFARLRFPWRSFWFGVVISTLMLPSVVTLIPTFILFRWLRWTDTLYPLIVPFWFGGGAFNIFLLRQFFMTIPLELDEAARIDGAGNFRVYWQIVLPLAKPALATVVIFSIINHWNEFVLPLIYLHSTENWTLAIGLQGFKGLYATQWHWLMAASTVMVLPLIILFFSAQRYYLEGIQMSGIAGRRTMSRSAVVDQRYRLQPGDLAGAAQRAVIRQVSFQGLEEMTPVLHLAGPLNKRLTLDANQRRELIATLRSSLCDDWIGQPIELRSGQRDAAPAILIVSPTAPRPVLEQVARLHTRSFSLWPSLWALLLLAALVALFWLERQEVLFQQILDWLQ